jgi:hypothetical protein
LPNNYPFFNVEINGKWIFWFGVFHKRGNGKNGGKIGVKLAKNIYFLALRRRKMDNYFVDKKRKKEMCHHYIYSDRGNEDYYCKCKLYFDEVLKGKYLMMMIEA